jgi:hypothetical protein
MRLQKAEKYSTSKWHPYPKAEGHKQTLVKNHKILGCRSRVFAVSFLVIREAVSLETRFSTFRVYFVISYSVLVMSKNSMLDILTSEDEITSSFLNV